MPTEQGDGLEAVAVRESLELLGAVFEPGDWICYDPFRADGRRWFTLADEDDAEQALRLALKRVRFVRKPAPPELFVTR